MQHGLLSPTNFGSNHSPDVKNWCPVFTTPRHEKRVAEHFRVREIEGFLPLIRTQRRWKDGSNPVVQLPLFPSYIFVRIGRGEHVSVLQVPGVKWIVGGLRESLPVPDSYIQLLREGLNQGKIEPHPYVNLVEGAKVRIRSGAMAGKEGVLLQKKNKFRVLLTLEMIMKSITVEVGIEDVEPVDPPASKCSSATILDGYSQTA
jgi:transcription antitermination factor NusG